MPSVGTIVASVIATKDINYGTSFLVNIAAKPHLLRKTYWASCSTFRIHGFEQDAVTNGESTVPFKLTWWVYVFIFLRNIGISPSLLLY